MEQILNILTTAGSKIILALLIWVIGKIVVDKLVGIVKKLSGFEKLDPTVKSFTENFVKYALYVVLIISIISVLGVPMASVVTVLASAGVAVGMALQGSLSNLAGGIMLMIFRPFSVGHYIVAAGEEGIVKEISLFYTVLTTLDNRRITIPNGTLMNANVTNCSAEPLRRVDLTFSLAKGTDIDTVLNVMMQEMKANPLVLADPEPFAKLIGGSNETMDFQLRAWCDDTKYWDVYLGLTDSVTRALGAAGVKAPAARIITEQAK